MTKLTQMFPNIYEEVRGKDVIDFGCGECHECLELAPHARTVTGVDIRESVFAESRKIAPANVSFTLDVKTKADIVLSLDAFEHFDDPAATLNKMKSLLHPSGYILASWGPPWLHPRGGHLFSFFPWCHVLLPERLLCAYRARYYRKDGAKRFREVEGGLNQLTLRRFENIVRDAGMRADIHPVPIHAARHFHNSLTRELLTSVVHARITAW